MAITNFIPEVWSARLQHRLFAWSAFRAATNTEYEGDVSAAGDTVRIFSLDDNITVKTYTRNADIDAPEELNTTEQTMTIDQQRYFNLGVDDLDARQARAGLIDTAVRKVGQGIDNYVAGLLSAVPVNQLGVNQAKADFDLDFVNQIKEWARMNNLPIDSLRVIVAPEVVRKIEDGYLDNTYGEFGLSRGFGTPQDPVTSGGLVGTIGGVEFYTSNNDNLYTFTGTGNSRAKSGLVAWVFDRRDVALVSQVANVEAFRPERRFADAVKGLYLYGARVLTPARILKFQFNL